MNEPAVNAFRFVAIYEKNAYNGVSMFVDSIIRIGGPLHSYCAKHADSPHGRCCYVEDEKGNLSVVTGILSFANTTFDTTTEITPGFVVSDFIQASWFAINGSQLTSLGLEPLPIDRDRIFDVIPTIKHF